MKHIVAILEPSDDSEEVEDSFTVPVVRENLVVVELEIEELWQKKYEEESIVDEK